VKKSLLIASLLAVALAGCGKKEAPANMVQQCGLDPATNETKCIYVPAQQAPGYMPQQQQQQPQVVQQAPAPVIVNNGGGAGDAALGMAAGMVVGNALSNAGNRGYDDSYERRRAEQRAYDAEHRAMKAENRAQLERDRAQLATQQQQFQQAQQQRPTPVSLQKIAPAPVQNAVPAYRQASQQLTIPPVRSAPPAPNYAPRNVVTPAYKPAYVPPAPKPVATPNYGRASVPVRQSSSSVNFTKASAPKPAPVKNFTVTRSTSSTSSSGFKR
jgi:hypothetical protein